MIEEPVEPDLASLSQALQQSIPELDATPHFTLQARPGHHRLCTVHFGEEGSIGFTIPTRYPFPAMRANLTARLIDSRILFALVRQSCPDLIGECDLWLGDVPELPALAFCGNSPSHVLIPDPQFVSSRGYQELRSESFRASLPTWSSRSKKLFWRGSLTGNPDRYPVADWRQIQRVVLCLRFRAESDFDFALTGDLFQAREESKRQEIIDAGLLAPYVTYRDFAAHRALIDIDGNSSSWSGLMTKMLLGSTVVKVDSPHGFHQWYYHRLRPWKNYIPVDGEFRELSAVAEWIRNNPVEAEEIAKEGRALADSITFESAMTEAVPRVIEYVRAAGNKSRPVRARAS